MKNNSSHYLVMLGKYTIYSYILSAILFTTALAKDSRAQGIVSVKEAVISVEITDKRIADAFKVIEEKTNYFFVFDPDRLDNKSKITIKRGKQTVENILLDISRQANVGFRQVNDRISVRVYDTRKFDRTVEVTIEKEMVTGKVLDENGEPLPGATIVVKESNNGTVTDMDGNFSLEVEKNAILVVSFIGYSSQEVAVRDQSELIIRMTPDLESLEEVVVVGYGTQKKKDVTGAVSSLSGQVVDDLPLTSADQALQGRMAGVQVVTSGAPGGYVAVRIRGTGTINNSDPLYVIDGFPVSGGISAINPDDIASIDVLKDASAAAIYGARGANGVVIITTKRGREGQTTIDISGYTGFQEVADPVEMLNASQYAVLNNEARINGGELLNPAFSDPLSLADSADWMDEIFQKGPIRNFTVSVRGGNSSVRYNLSGGYFRQEGVIIGSGFDRKSFRFNLDHDAKEWLKIGNSLSYSLSTFQNDGGGGFVRDAMNALPFQPVQRNGTFSGPEGIAEFDGDVTNPVGLAAIRDFTDTKHRILDNLFVSLQPVKWLTFRSEFGVDFAFERTRNWTPKYKWGVKEQVVSSLYESAAERIDWLWDNTVTYSLEKANHSLKVLAGISAQHSSNKFIGASGQEFVSDVANQLDNIQDNENVFGASSEFALLSYIGRINYDFNNKYLITMTGRYDGSSRFGSNNRFGFFPSASAAWRISEESFLSGSPLINDLKLRAGYGVTGNQNSIPAFGYVALLDPTYRYTFGNVQAPAIVPQNFPNKDLRWEKVIQSNVALDVMLFNGLIGMTIEYYVRGTEDMLVESPIPITSGFFDAGRPILNVGAVRNQGLEFAINLEKEFNGLIWSSDLNGSFNRNEILRLSGPNGDDPIPRGQITFNKTAARLAVGHPINAFYGYVTDGIFQNGEEIENHAVQTAGTNPANSTSPGDIRFKNLNDDLDINDDDRRFIGNPNPDVYYGWTNRLTYKGFDLSVFIQGVYGNEIFNANRIFSEAMAVAQNQTVSTLNRWRGPGTSHEMPRATTTDPNNNQRVSDRYIEDGSYLRIKNLTFGYSLPSAVIDVLKIRKVRAYISIQNLLTVTDYSGFDPEVDISGIDNSVYPQSRIYTAGLNISL